VLIVLERIVFFYKANKWTLGKLRPHVDYSVADPVKFGNVPFLNNVAAAILTELKMHDGFEFDPVQSLRYLNFRNGCWDRDADALVPTRPDMYITHCTGWSYQDFQHPELDSLDKALERVRREQGEDLSKEYTMSPELEDEFTRIGATMPELQVYYEWLDDLATVVYILQHETRAVFGKPMAEHLVIRSSGRGGKDTYVDKIASLIGTYFHTVEYDQLCTVKDGDKPSPVLSELPGKRVMAVRECGEQKMQASTFKRICDPSSTMQARALYKDTVTFHAYSLPILLTNGSLEFTKKDDACDARIACIEFRKVFTNKATAANEVRCKDIRPFFPDWRVGTFAVLKLVYKHLMKDRHMRNVAPIPPACVLARNANIVDQAKGRLRSILMENITPVDKPEKATVPLDVDKFMATAMEIERKNIRTTLQGLGMDQKQAKYKSGKGYAQPLCYRFKFGEKTKWVALAAENPTPDSLLGGSSSSTRGL
jgi:hypothetical protein